MLIVPKHRFTASNEGWTSGSAAGLSAPIMTWTGGALRLTSTSNVTGFGFWQSPLDAITAAGASGYLATFTINTDTAQPGETAAVRLHLFTEDNQSFHYSEFPIIPFLEESAEGITKFTLTLKTLYEPPAVAAPNDGIGVTFDLINFNLFSPLDYEAELDSVIIQPITAPVLP